MNSVDEEIAGATAAVWNISRNIRDSIKISRIAKSVEDVEWLVMIQNRRKFYISPTSSSPI
jgi:hypothetical protein